MNDETREKESDQQRRLEIEPALVVRGGLGEGQEEQKPADEERRVVRHEHGEAHEGELDGRDPAGHRLVGVFGLSGGSEGPIPLHRDEFTAEGEIVEDGRNDDAERRLVAEIYQHEKRIPFPRPRHHQHGRSGEMSERAADGHVDEQQPNRGVGEARRRFQDVELPREQQGPDGHGGGLGDERPEQRSHDQNRQPPGSGRAATDRGHQAQAALREFQHRPGARDRHDDHHEHRLGKVHRVPDVPDDRRPAVEPGDRAGEHEDPDAEHRLDLAEEVQDLPLETHLVRAAVVVGIRVPPVVPFRHPGRMFSFGDVRPVPKLRGEKRVNDREQEDAGGDHIERLRSRPVEDEVEYACARRILITFQHAGQGDGSVRCAADGSTQQETEE